MAEKAPNSVPAGERDTQPSSVVARPPAFGAGLCDSAEVLTPEARAQLNKDLATLAQERRDAEAASGNVRLS